MATAAKTRAGADLLRIHICGARGSAPAPGAEFARYGGNTSCVALAGDADDAPTLILDAGTGLRRVTGLLGGQPYAGAILLSHLHWDHVQGLPFFAAGDDPAARVSLLLPGQPGGADAESVLARGMSPPHFPIRPSQLRGSWQFGSAEPGPFKAGRFAVEAREIPHKGGRTFGYRVSDGRSVVAYLPDHCPTNLGPGPDGWGEYHPDALALAGGADYLIHDASLLPAELPAQASFGHAAADYAVGLGARAGARRVVLFHHRPDRTDDQLDELGRRFAGAGVPVTVAAEQEILEA
ncbi:MAG: MBL fold metallo-hydrolase [Actinomycetota bacterium]